eukprot:scaffold300_cov258-Pinguiococcus_pyrenoidosus.AAC.48
MPPDVLCQLRHHLSDNHNGLQIWWSSPLSSPSSLASTFWFAGFSVASSSVRYLSSYPPVLQSTTPYQLTLLQKVPKVRGDGFISRTQTTAPTTELERLSNGSGSSLPCPSSPATLDAWRRGPP